MSKTSEFGSGRIYPLNTHGSIVYLTQGERYFLYGLMVAGVIFALLTAIIYFTGDKHGRMGG